MMFAPFCVKGVFFFIKDVIKSKLIAMFLFGEMTNEPKGIKSKWVRTERSEHTHQDL